jgi:hypothetical protein
VKRLGPTLAQLPSQAARARAVQKMIAKIADAETVPAIHTVELWLAEHPQKILSENPDRKFEKSTPETDDLQSPQ